MNIASPQLQEEARDRIRKRHHRRIKAGDGVGILAMSADAVGLRTKDPRMVSITITTDDVDLEREVIVPDGIDWKYFEINKNIFADHQTDIYSGVASLRTLTPIMASVGGVRKMRGWTINGPVHDTELGDHCLKFVRAGCMASSLGFLSNDAGAPTKEELKAFSYGGDEPDWIHRATAAIEATMTLLPCNAPCRVRMADGDTKSIVMSGYDAAESLLSQGLVTKSSAKAFGMPIKVGIQVPVKWVRKRA